ncbi:tryptophan--tRNA ligase [Patescibacteria group bacterium]|nr:tryptophan--tRNA ligase [Patescibacteria group bacterium]
MTKTLFSGIQPTGQIHIGNYLGALKNWVDLQKQKQYNCFFCIVDLHAITIDYDAKSYQEKILDTAMDLLAIGIVPKNSILFVQSHVPEHTELCWLLNTLTPISELQRMTQFKDKSQQNKKNINAGLFDYPVLQAADILLYNTDVVPVGEDQLQHLELTNMIARKFNHKFGRYLKEIKPIVSHGARIMSLADPTKKMSKSLGPNHYIALSDSPEIIEKKIMRAVTDSGPEADIGYKINFPKTGSYELGLMETKSGIENLFNILDGLINKNKTGAKIFESMLDQYKNGQKISYYNLKKEVIKILITFLKPIQENKVKLLKDKKKVQEILSEGAKRARKIARKNILEIKKRMGLV